MIKDCWRDSSCENKLRYWMVQKHYNSIKESQPVECLQMGQVFLWAFQVFVFDFIAAAMKYLVLTKLLSLA